MPIVDNNTTLTQFKNNAKCDMVSMAFDYLSKLRIGESCKKELCNIEKLNNLNKSLAHYTPTDTIVSNSVEAEAAIDLSGIDGNTLADGMTVTVTVTISGILYTLASFTEDYYEVAPSVLISDINTAINAGGSGFTSIVNGTDLILTAPQNLGSIPNGTSVSVLLAPRYTFTAACEAESGVGVGTPGWAGLAFNSTDGYVYAANSGGTKKSYWWNGTGSLVTPPPPTGTLAQCTATTTNNEGVILNPAAGGTLYIGSSEFSPPKVNLNATSLGLSCLAAITPALGYAKDMRPKVYSPVNGTVYFAGVGINIEEVNTFGVTRTITTVNGATSIYNITNMAVDPFSGNVWVLGVYNQITHYAFGIVKALDLIPSIQMVVTGIVGTDLTPTKIVYVDSLEQMAIIYNDAGLIKFYDLSGNEVDSVVYTPPVGTLESICYDTINDKIILGRSNGSIEVLSATGVLEATFTAPPTFSGTASWIAESAGELYVAISQVPLSKLYLAKMSYISSGNSYPGTFTGGITGVTISEDDNCITESSAQKVVDKIKAIGNLCSDCDDLISDTITPHNAFGALTGPGTYLTDDSGVYIVDDEGNYILAE